MIDQNEYDYFNSFLEMIHSTLSIPIPEVELPFLPLQVIINNQQEI